MRIRTDAVTIFERGPRSVNDRPVRRVNTVYSFFGTSHGIVRTMDDAHNVRVCLDTPTTPRRRCRAHYYIKRERHNKSPGQCARGIKGRRRRATRYYDDDAVEGKDFALFFSPVRFYILLLLLLLFFFAARTHGRTHTSENSIRTEERPIINQR